MNDLELTVHAAEEAGKLLKANFYKANFACYLIKERFCF